MIKRPQRKEVLKGAFFFFSLVVMIGLMFAFGLGTSEISLSDNLFTCFESLNGIVSCRIG